MNRWLLGLGLLIAWGAAAHSQADTKVEAPTSTAPLTVKYEKGAKAHRAIVPRKFLAAFKLSQAEEAGEVQLAGREGRTILAGCALSLAIGSVVVFRRQMRRASLALVAGALVFTAGSVGWADFTPPADFAPPGKKPAPTIVIEVVEKGDAVTLILPQ